MPCPSADTKFVLRILNFLKNTQNDFVLKSEILLHKLDHLNILKTFSVYFINLSIPKNLSIFKTNFVSADGLGSTCIVPLQSSYAWRLINKNMHTSISLEIQKL